MVQMLVRSQVVEKAKSRQGRPRSWGCARSAATGWGRGSARTAHEASDSQGTGATRSAMQLAALAAEQTTP